MNKAVPWNINGVGFDAREAAREAARRQGKSLGEWLHAVIADHAAEMGVAESEMAGQERIDAVTSRLERMSTRAADFDRHDRYDRDVGRRDTGRSTREDLDRSTRGDPGRQRRVGTDEPEERSAPRRATRADRFDDTEFLLDDAIETMNRRAARAERRTDSALASFADMLEANEAKRERERDAVSDLSRKLSTIESKLTDRIDGADQSPIKGALARLEARLETIGRRANAETDVKKSAVAFGADVGVPGAEPIRRLEDKLNSILEAVATRPPATQPESHIPQAAYALQAIGPEAFETQPIGQTSPAALAAAQGKAHFPHRRLGDAIADIAGRQRSLEASAGIQVTPKAPREDRDRAAFSAMQQEIASLASKIEDMRRDVVKKDEPRPNPDLLDLRAEIASMSRSLGALAPRGTVSSLESAIRNLTQRLEATREGNGGLAATPPPLDRLAGDLRPARDDREKRTPTDARQTDLRSIATKVDDLAIVGPDSPTLSVIQEQMHEIRGLIASAAARPSESDAAAATRAATQPLGRRDVVTDAVDRNGLGKIEARLEALTAKIDEAARGAARASIEAETSRRRFDLAQDELAARVVAKLPAPSADVSSLSALVSDLGRKIEAVQQPGASERALDALQDQIALLSERFGQSERGLASIGTLERSMQTLFSHLEETRAKVETTAAQAAREALTIALEEGRGFDSSENARHVAALRTIQDEAETRTASTLNAVHETLEKVVDRLATMEGDLAETRSWRDEARTQLSRAAPAEAIRRPAPATTRPTMPMTLGGAGQTNVGAGQPILGAGQSILGAGQSMLGAGQPMLDSANAVARPAPRPIVEKRAEIDDEGNRADFIAAARRAAKIAQSDPSVTALKTQGGGRPARAGLMEKSRDYVASHKKPVLLSFAALFVVLGTMAIMQRTMVQSDEMVAEHRAPAPSAKSYASASRSGQNELTPSALPKAAQIPAPAPRLPMVTATNTPGMLSADPTGSGVPLSNPIPGSDPIQTGSIPNLPAFAARGATPPQRAGLPNALRTLADAGDGPAEYELGARYAEGRSVPRDLKLAAQWYTKAADQGIAPAQYRLASLYEKGLGVTQDKGKAKALYTRAAEAGNPRAMHNLAVMLADGDGQPDYDGAATWFKKAAQYGVHDSEYNLAILLARGLGTPQSFVQSYQWFAIAADQNDADAAKKRDEVGVKMSASDLAVAKALAASFRPRAASPAATEVEPPPGGWDGAATSSHINSAGAKLSSL